MRFTALAVVRCGAAACGLQCVSVLERLQAAADGVASLQAGRPLEPEAESLADAEAALEVAQGKWADLVVTASRRFTGDHGASGASVADFLSHQDVVGWQAAVKQAEDRLQLAQKAASKQVGGASPSPYPVPHMGVCACCLCGLECSCVRACEVGTELPLAVHARGGSVRLPRVAFCASVRAVLDLGSPPPHAHHPTPPRPLSRRELRRLTRLGRTRVAVRGWLIWSAAWTLLPLPARR